MLEKTRYLLPELITGLADAMDLVSPALTGHHKRVARMAGALASELGLSDKERYTIVSAGLLHDSGALSLHEKLGALRFESDFAPTGTSSHAYMGYVLLRRFDVFSEVANVVRHHHLWWERAAESCPNEELALTANLLHLADRIDVLIDRQQEILGQVPAIMERIEKQSGRMFAPSHVDVLRAVSRKESFWLDIVSPCLPSLVDSSLEGWNHGLTNDELLSLAKVFSTIIDFRSRFTATHSAGVSSSAVSLAKLRGLSPLECRAMRLAGYLHDLGKLAVPSEILEKPDKLTNTEFAVIRSHTYYTYRVLEKISGLETVNEWASFHHERLNGDGYPFHRSGDTLSLGSRIMAVADVLTAITEDRPYRAGMPPEKAMGILTSMAESGVLDRSIVALARENFDEVNQARALAQSTALEEFESYAENTGEFQVD
ncbi:MAG: HD domain-containing phosphohydrolase [Pseudomonadota bacterium]